MPAKVVLMSDYVSITAVTDSVKVIADERPVPHAKDMPYHEVLFDIIAASYADLPNRYAKLARDARVTPRTALNWLARTHAPRVSQLLTLARNNRAIRSAVLDLIANLEQRTYKTSTFL